MYPTPGVPPAPPPPVPIAISRVFHLTCFVPPLHESDLPTDLHLTCFSISRVSSSHVCPGKSYKNRKHPRSREGAAQERLQVREVREEEGAFRAWREDGGGGSSRRPASGW